ncbi:hypothetical protein GCM10017714_22080 [Curtobacterium pusillum]|nr:hypothetical protein GCM10017610_23550 [Curtobacterium pusillum]
MGLGGRPFAAVRIPGGYAWFLTHAGDRLDVTASLTWRLIAHRWPRECTPTRDRLRDPPTATRRWIIAMAEARPGRLARCPHPCGVTFGKQPISRVRRAVATSKLRPPT